jgi:hypothetical protein
LEKRALSHLDQDVVVARRRLVDVGDTEYLTGSP